jgi:PAS domain S-box-containing protein/putative nucleotidyltransferase with HDIG domain
MILATVGGPAGQCVLVEAEMGKKEKDDGVKKRDKAPSKEPARDESGAGKAGHQLKFISSDETRYSELFNHMSSGVAVYEAVDDGEDFIFKDFNPAAEKIERVSRGEVIGRRVTEVFPGVKSFGLFKVFQRVWHSGQAEYFPDSIYRDERDPGSWRENWVYRLPGGEIVAVYSDITERKLAEHSLRQSEVRMNSILSAMTELVFVLDDEGRFVSYHGSAQELYASPDTFIGKKYSAIMPTHFNDLTSGAIARNRAGKASKFDYSLQVPAGLQHYAATMSPIMIDGKYTGSVLVARNITERAQSMEALSASEEKYRTLVENINDVMYTLDNEGRITYVSPAVERFTKYKVADLVGQPFTPMIHPDDLPGLVASFDKLLSGQLEPWEFRVLDKDGRIIWVRSSSRPIYEAGRIIGVSALMTDITAHKLVEQALGRQREEYRTILDSVPIIITYIDRDGRFIRINKAGADAFGIPPKEVVGKTFSNFFPPEQAARFLASSREVMDTKIPLLGSIGQVTLPSKQVIWTYTDIVPYLDNNGNSIGSINVVMDITGRKLAEEALLDSEERFRNMANMLPQTIFESDAEGNFTFVNQQGYEMFGYTVGDIAAGVNVLQTIVPEDRERAINNIALRIQGEQLPANEYTAITKDGRTFPVAIYASPIITGSAYAGMRGMLIDITERKQMEQDLKNSVDRLHKTLNDAVITMGAIVEMKDPYTAGHQLQVARLAAAIAREMGLPEAQVNIIRTTAAIHDIGKIYVPSDILAKPGKLGALEISIIRTHAQGSYDILKNIDFGGPVPQIALQHHERLDGSGYPQGLKGDEIMLEAKILAISDVVEAMASHRPYRPSLGIDKALEEIRQNRGTLYDPDAVDACLKIFSQDGFIFD